MTRAKQVSGGSRKTIYLDARDISMRDDPICREKWRVQRKFARMAGYDAGRYLDLVEESVRKWAEKNGVRLKYADVSNMKVGPLLVKESPVGYTTVAKTAEEKTGAGGRAKKRTRKT